MSYVNRDFMPPFLTNLIFVGDKWPGPALPTPLYGHCLQKLNRSHFVLIGGHDGKNPISKVSFFDGSQWIEGPNLRIARKYHSCALLHSLLVVAGGETVNGGITAEVEFLNLEEDSMGRGQMHWIKGRSTLKNVGNFVPHQPPDRLLT